MLTRRPVSTNNGDTAPLIPQSSAASAPSSSVGAGTVGAFGALIVLLVVSGVLAITFGVLWGQGRGGSGTSLPTRFTAETVPAAANDLMLEFYTRTNCGDRASPDTPTKSHMLGFEPCYFNTNTTVKLPFLDEPTPRELLYAEFHGRYTSVLGSGHMTEAQEAPLREMFGKTSPYDAWVLKADGEIPQKCLDMYRVLHNQKLALNARWFDNELSWSLITVGPGFTTNQAKTLPVYNSSTLEMYLSELTKLKNMMIQARTAGFYERQHAYILARFGVGYSLYTAITEITDTADGLDFLWNSLDFDDGSSLIYDVVIFKAAEHNYFLSPAEDAALRTAITDVETEAIEFITYQDTVFQALPLFDDVTITNGYFEGESRVAFTRAFSGNVNAECVAAAVEGTWTRNATQFYEQITSEWLTYRGIAEAIFTAEVPDYLGWNLTWVHVYYGTEAEVTELGFYPPTDCPNDDETDPAFQFGGCDDASGNAFVTVMQGDFLNRGFGSALNLGPLQPKGAVLAVNVHESVHWNHVSRLCHACPKCHYACLLLLSDSGSVPSAPDSYAGLEGLAMYVERNGTLDDMLSLGIRGSGSLREAAMALMQINVRYERAAARMSIPSGQVSLNDYSLFEEENQWYPWDDLQVAQVFHDTVAWQPHPLDERIWYTAGAYRIQKLREDVIAACGGNGTHHKRVWDAAMSVPASVSAMEIAVAAYIASECKEWPYETNAY